MALSTTVKSRDGRVDLVGLNRVLRKLSSVSLGPDASPSFTGLTLNGLTASRLVATNATKGLSSVADLSSWVAGTANEINVVSDGDGSITIGLVDPVIVGKGGTGLATLTDHGILLGSGTGAVTPLAAATNGQIPIGSTGADPVLAGITGTANQVVVANAAGSITLSAPQDLHTGASPTFAGITVDTDTVHVDSTNHRLGINTLLPLQAIYAVEHAYSGVSRGIHSVEYGAHAHSAHLTGRKARGTEASPLTVAVGDGLAGFTAEAYDGSNWIRSGYLTWTVEDLTAGDVTTSITLKHCKAGVETSVFNYYDADGFLFGSDTNPFTALGNRGLTIVSEGQTEVNQLSYFDSGLVCGQRLSACSGTQVSPAATQSGQGCFVGLCGHDGTNYVTSSRGMLSIIADGTWTSTSHPTQIEFATCPVGAIARTTRLTVGSDGHAYLSNSLSLKEQSSAMSDTAAYGQYWVKDTDPCEPYFTDDAGTDSLIVLNGTNPVVKGITLTGGGPATAGSLYSDSSWGFLVLPRISGAIGAFGIRNAADTSSLFILEDSGNLKLGGVVSIKERASAMADTAGYGQLWVKNTTPCQLWFTDDAGTDTQIV